MTAAAPAGFGTRTYIAEIHDVSPRFERETMDALALLPAPAREATALLVVPRWGDEWELRRHPHFARWLASHRGELVLHGLTHSLGPGWWDAAWFGTERESEFASLSSAEANARVGEGVELLGDATGRAPRWFCAPRWQQGPEVAGALRAAGVRGYMLRDRLVGTAAELRSRAVWLDDGERALTRLLARAPRRVALRGLLGSGRPFRLAIHPRDIRLADARRELVALLERLANDGWRAVPLPDPDDIAALSARGAA